MRIKRGVNAVKKRRKILKLAKGYFGGRSKRYRVAREAVMKAGLYAYYGRKAKKRKVYGVRAVQLKHGVSFKVNHMAAVSRKAACIGFFGNEIHRCGLV